MPPAHDPRPVLTFSYTNYGGKRAERRVRPIRLWYGETEWHTGRQWFLHGEDVDRGEYRDFAMADMEEIVRG